MTFKHFLRYRPLGKILLKYRFEEILIDFLINEWEVMGTN